MDKQKRKPILWIARASNNQKPDIRHPNPDYIAATYAYDQTEAEKNLASWFAQHPEQPYHYFTEQPNGFLTGQRTWLPGHIPCHKAKELEPNSEDLK